MRWGASGTHNAKAQDTREMADATDDIFTGDSEEDIAMVRHMIEKIRLEIMAHGEGEHDSYDPESLQKVEFNIQINRVTSILQEMYETLEVLFCLPWICRNQELLAKHFSAEEQDMLRLLCRYMRSNEEGVVPGVFNMADFQFPRMGFIELVGMISKKDVHKAIVNQVNDLPGVYRKFLSNIREFRKFTINKMKMTAQKDLAKEKILHRMWKSNERNKMKIAKIEEILSEKQAAFRKEVEEKTAVIEKLQADIQRLEEQSRKQINAFIDESDRTMFRYFEQSDQRYELLEEEANRQMKTYQQTLEEDLRVEKENRIKKANLTQQLQMLLGKYDKDAGTRTKELNALSYTLRTRLEEFDKWKTTMFDPQEKKYFEAIEERRLDEQRAHEEALYLFMMNRAAKVLQRAWRSVAERKRKMRGRRGGRKGKGKK